MRILPSSSIKKPPRRWRYYAMAAMQVLAVLGSTNIASASIDDCDITTNPTTKNCLNGEDLYSINTNTPIYEPSDTDCSDVATAVPASLNTSGSGSTAIVPPGQGTGTWNSGIASDSKPILEQFMIELLKDIAKKRGVPESNAVTQQHVIALIAFAWGEGGGLTNNNFWNPFNTGLKADDLVVPGTQATNGSTETFKSFDAGVEAAARVMTGDTQGRLGVTLTEPNSTATDFLNSLLDFSPLSQGHYPWAEASDPSSKYYEPNYKQAHLDLIAQVTKSYDNMASTIMRKQSSDPSDAHDTSKLHFHTDGSIVNVSLPTNSCNNTASPPSGGAFFDVAKAYSWPSYHAAPYCVMKPEYAAAVTAALARIKSGKNDFVGGGDSTVSTATKAGDCSGGHAGIDCGGFVTRVFRDSKADPNYNNNTGGVADQYAYVAAHPSLYKRISNPKVPSDLQPGDIYYSQSLGHTYIYVGSLGYPKNNAVSASYSIWRTPMASNIDSSDVQSGIWYQPLFPLNGAPSLAA